MIDQKKGTGNSMNMEDRKALAKLLFISGLCPTQKELADRVKVSEQTISKWANKERWDEQKRSLLTIRQEQLSRLYLLLEYYVKKVEDQVKNRNGSINTKDTDVIIKLTGAIKNLEIELSVGEVVDVFMKYNEHIRKLAPERMKEQVEMQDAYIKSLL